MPRADFYLVGKPRFREEPLRLVCELARKAHDAGQWTLVLARDQAQAEALDDLLWAFDEDAYVPHQLAGDEEDDLAPVLIATPAMSRCAQRWPSVKRARKQPAVMAPAQRPPML